MKNIFRSRRNKSPHKNEEQKDKSEAPFFDKEGQTDNSQTPFFSPNNVVQTKLNVGQPGDKYEKEADSVADAVVNHSNNTPAVQNKEISQVQRTTLATPAEDEKLSTAEGRMEKDKLIQEKPQEEEPIQAKEEEEAVQAKEEEEPVQTKEEEEPIQKMEEEEGVQAKEEEEPAPMPVQTKANNTAAAQTASTGLSQQIKNKAGKGKKMPDKTRAEMESGIGADFNDVNIHTDKEAAEMNKELGAQAFTHGKDVYFNEGKFNPENTAGKRLLAHELTHVVQQGKNNKIQRQNTPSTEKGLNYNLAKKLNKKYSKEKHLGWSNKLKLVTKGKFKEWDTLWAAGKWNEFADKVAIYQKSIGLNKKAIDGILGLKTWAKIGGLGEAMAGIEKVYGDARNTCTLASKQRIQKGLKLLGKKLNFPKGKTMSVFNSILQSHVSKMKDIDQKYRGTGAAGAVVYAGLGSFVSEADIWKGKLKPGAALQVWSYTAAFEYLHAGKDNKKRPSFHGTSLIFVNYTKADFSELRVRHFGGSETVTKGNYAKWIAANIN